MPSITIKNIPADMYESLKKQAAANQRSITAEIIYLIEQSVSKKDAIEPDHASRAKILRKAQGKRRISLKEYEEAVLKDIL